MESLSESVGGGLGGYNVAIVDISYSLSGHSISLNHIEDDEFVHDLCQQLVALRRADTDDLTSRPRGPSGSCEAHLERLRQSWDTCEKRTKGEARERRQQLKEKD